MRREQGVALGEHPRVLPAVARAQRPDRRHDLVQVGTAQGRRPLQQLEPVGQEDAHQGPVLDVEQALDGPSVGGHPLRLPGLEADAELVRA